MDNLPIQKFNPQSSRDLDIEAIISAPLTAVSKANVNMVTGQAKFLLDYCFEYDKDKKTYDPIMITMSYTKTFINPDSNPSDADYFQQQQLTFMLPLLSIVPLNSLAIDKMTLEFDLEITSSVANSGNSILDNKAQLNGKITSDPKDSNKNDQYKSQSSSRLKVNINASTLPLPVGVLTIIDLYSKSVQPTPAPITPVNPVK